MEIFRSKIDFKFRELLSFWTVDTSRAIDYLEFRDDIDSDNIFYMGMSYGALLTPHVLFFENRFKAAIFYVGGVNPSTPPMADGINLLPRFTTPVLMLNGEQDYLIPQTLPKMFYGQIGTKEEDKRLVFYQSGHWPLPRNQMITETLNWIEKYSTNQ